MLGSHIATSGVRRLKTKGVGLESLLGRSGSYRWISSLPPKRQVVIVRMTDKLVPYETARRWMQELVLAKAKKPENPERDPNDYIILLQHEYVLSIRYPHFPTFIFYLPLHLILIRSLSP